MVCFDVHYVQSRPAPRDGKEKPDLRPDAGNAGPELAQRGRLPPRIRRHRHTRLRRQTASASSTVPRRW